MSGHISQYFACGYVKYILESLFLVYSHVVSYSHESYSMLKNEIGAPLYCIIPFHSFLIDRPTT